MELDNPDPQPVLTKTSAITRLVLLLLFVALAAAVGFFLAPSDVDAIRAWAADIGWGGAVLFLFGYAALTLTPVPKNLLGIAAGVVWGFGIALVLVYVGALIGAAASFVIGRLLGREAVERLTGARIARLDDLLARRGFLAVLGVRLVPVIPFTLINYGAGLTSVRTRDYALGTAIGILPGSAAYVALGAFGFEFGPPFWIALTVLGVLALAGVVAAAVLQRRKRVDEAGADA
ncbi:TVP38/TMEM64 family protein [Microbacterium sp. SLBN-146]|uniref:TVP38/TMEM64 family protein n=1 Tax=Microbacterium sp. SLBN-146 TaxID=2768457 RepID=UPI0011679AF8|nr:TVP38/TMEM64 family protein [Microbacterium sp. SLBN-146]TQJ30942.1 putative membrane protein YdjX (TVP38/TMEM64 family) [Microbacterium sp. SLBN-146]